MKQIDFISSENVVNIKPSEKINFTEEKSYAKYDAVLKIKIGENLNKLKNQ